MVAFISNPPLIRGNVAIPFRIIVKIVCLVNVPSKQILHLLKNVILTYFSIFTFSNVAAKTERS